MKTLIRLLMMFGMMLLLLTVVFSLARREEPTVAWMFIYDNGNLVRMHPDGSFSERIFPNVYFPIASSPNGKWLVFLAKEPDGGFGLYRIPGYGRRVSRVTDWDRSFHIETWTPDSLSLVFTELNAHYGHIIYSLNLANGTRYRLSNSARFVTVSPDSRWVYLSVSQSGNDPRSLIRIRFDGTEQQIVTNMDQFAAWSLSGEWLYVMRGDYELFRLRPDGTQLQQLTDQSAYFASSSPDGHWILYRTAAHDGTLELFRMREDGSDKGRLTFSQRPHNRQFITWGQAGGWFLYASLEEDGWYIYRELLNGGERRLIAITYGEEPAVYISPDSEWIVYYDRDPATGNPELYSVHTSGGENHPIATGLWYPRFQTWSPDSQWIYYHDFDGEKGPLVRIRPDGSDRQVLTNPNHYAEFGAWSPLINLPYTPTILSVLSIILLGGGLCASYLRSRP